MAEDFTDEFADADLNSEPGLPLGLLDADIVLRDDETFRSTATRKQRPTEDKESQRWVNGYGKALELARQLPDCEVFSISDREGDIYEVYQAWLLADGGPRAEWIIRANQDRALVNVADGDPAMLCAALREAPVLGVVEFDDRLADPLSDPSRAAVPGPAVRLRV